MKRIFFVRHGEYSGLLLSEDGRDQSAQIGSVISGVLNDYGAGGAGQIITSRVSRAKETAQIIRDTLVQSGQNVLNVQEDAGVTVCDKVYIPLCDTGVFKNDESDFIIVVTHKPNIEEYARELLGQNCSPYYASGFCVTADSFEDIQNKKGTFMEVAYNQSPDPVQSIPPLRPAEDKPSAKGHVTPKANEEFAPKEPQSPVMLFIVTPAEQYNNKQAEYLAEAIEEDMLKLLERTPQRIEMLIWLMRMVQNVPNKQVNIIRSTLNIEDRKIHVVTKYCDAMGEAYGVLGYRKKELLQEPGTDAVIMLVHPDKVRDMISVFMGSYGRL
jgi:phosphohistidine phosphatase SixA